MGKRLLSAIGAIAAAALATGVVATDARAADLATPYAKVAAQPMAPSWAGLYLGVQGGLAQTYSTWNDLDGIYNGSSNAIGKTGGAVGGNIGYNWQDRSFVWGVETDANWVGAKGSQSLESGTVIQSGSVDWVGSFRGRAGLDFESTLLYLTGGLAYGGVKNSVVQTGNGEENNSATKLGWTAGVGIEHMFAGSWTARAEVRYTDLGNSTVQCQQYLGGTCSGDRANFANTLWTGLVGVGYKF